MLLNKRGYYKLKAQVYCFRLDEPTPGWGSEVADVGEVIHLEHFFDGTKPPVQFERLLRPGIKWTATWSACEDAFVRVSPLEILALEGIDQHDATEVQSEDQES